MRTTPTGGRRALIDLAQNRNVRRARRGRGRDYGPTVLRDAVWTAYETLIGELDAFQYAADCDLAALLHDELRDVVAAYERLKQRAGALDFVDLLLRARDLLAAHPRVRRAFQSRFTHVFVDEFQDTDPLQAEILLLLAADDPAEREWRRITPVPGKLFIVGDPKQAIYRFRRADVETYQEVCDLLEGRGARRAFLHTSFRATPGIQQVVNAAFGPLMTGDRATLQAHYVGAVALPSRHERPAGGDRATGAGAVRAAARRRLRDREIAACRGRRLRPLAAEGERLDGHRTDRARRAADCGADRAAARLHPVPAVPAVRRRT